MTVNDIAKVAYEANRAYNKALGVTSGTWELFPEEEKRDYVAGVQFVLDNPDITPEDLHDEWLKTKINKGWTYGHVTNEGMKIHHCLVPFEDLPVKQKAKDYIFHAIVENLMPLLSVAKGD